MSFTKKLSRVVLAAVLFACAGLAFGQVHLQETARLGATGIISKTFRISTPNLVVVEAVSLDAEPWLTIQTPDGKLIDGVQNGRQATAIFYAGAAGQYTVRAVDELASPNTEVILRAQTPASIATLTAGRAIDGSIASNDTLTEDGTRADFYRLTVPAPGKVLVLVESNEIDPKVRIYKPDGSVVDNDDYFDTNAGAIVEAPVGSTLFIRAEPYSSDNYGAYKISATPRQTSDLQLDREVSGTLQETRISQNDYSFRPTAAGRYVLEITGSDLYPGVSLRLGSDEETDYGRTDSLYQRRFSLQAGQNLDFTVRGGGSSNNFKVKVSRMAPPVPITLGRTVNGNLTLGEVKDFSYTNTTREVQNLRVDLNSNDFDTYLTVILPDGRTLEKDDSPTRDQIYRSYLNVPVEPGATITIGAGSYADGYVGAFSLLVEQIAGGGAILVDGASVQVPGSYAGTLEGYAQSFNLALNQDATVAITLVSDDFDAYLEVVGPNGQGWEDDDGYGGTNSFLDFTAPVRGTYTVVVRGYSEDAYGNFELDLSQAVPRRVDPIIARDLNGTYAEVQIQATAGELLTIEVSSQEFDTIAALYSPSGQFITENDDGPGGSDSRIVVRAAETGRYTLEISAYGGETTGRYQVSVSRQ